MHLNIASDTRTTEYEPKTYRIISVIIRDYFYNIAFFKSQFIIIFASVRMSGFNLDSTFWNVDEKLKSAPYNEFQRVLIANRVTAVLNTI